MQSRSTCRIGAGEKWRRACVAMNSADASSADVNLPPGEWFVAVDANGNPIDTDTDGTPDYVEDTNGNGTLDGGENNWGLAIILMTVCLRLLLFPLTLKSIKSTVAMRRLKPEVDALNERYKDDAQAKNLAMMELWKKNGINPIGGCLPQLVQMPVWFAMYTTLQTATEMYHTQFMWFRDMSAPDRGL